MKTSHLGRSSPKSLTLCSFGHPFMLDKRESIAAKRRACSTSPNSAGCSTQAKLLSEEGSLVDDFGLAFWGRGNSVLSLAGES